MSVDSSAVLTARHCRFSSNSADGGGGALRFDKGLGHLIDCDFQSNSDT